MAAEHQPTQMQPERTDSGRAESDVQRPGRDRLRAAAGAAIASYLRPMWATLAFCFLVFAVSHALVLPPGVRWIMFAVALVSSATFAMGAVWVGHGRITGPTAIMLGGLTALLLWLQSAVHLLLLQQPWEITDLIMVLMGTAVLLLDRMWFFTIAALCAGAWLAAVILLPAETLWLHFGYALLTSEVIAVVIHIVRTRDLLHIQGLRMAEEQHKLQLELALQDARLRLASIWHNSCDGLVISDEKGRLLAVNRTAARLVGCQEADLPGRHWTELLSKDTDLDAADRAYTWAFNSPGSVPVEEREVVLADGRHLWLAASHLRLPQPDGHDQLLTLVRDVTERRRFDEERLAIQRRVQEAQCLESLGVLAGGIAHDFNNLLTGILGNLELVRSQLPGQSRGHEYIAQAGIAAKRAADLCRQMLAFAGRSPFVIQELDLNALVVRTAGLLSASLPRMVRLDLNLAPGLPGLRADPSQLSQVVMNLVFNSAEAIGDRPGVITVSTRTATLDEARYAAVTAQDASAEIYLCLQVRDDGGGMTSEIQARIFEPFFSTKFTGRGLGLAAVVGIIRAHGGGLSVDSKPGQGSTFRIVLPALDRPVEPSPAEAPRTLEWRGEGTVLVIDDEELIRELLRTQLEGLGFQVLVADDGAAGIDVVCQHAGSIRIILLDLIMPRMDGRQVLGALRDLPGSPPVILMSGCSEEENQQRFAGAGASAFLQKPFTLQQLASRIRQVLSAAKEPGALRSTIP